MKTSESVCGSQSNIGWITYTFEWNYGYISFTYYPYNHSMHFELQDEDMEIGFDYTI